MSEGGISRAAFARLRGVNRSSVTRWEQAGRLVLTPDGNIDAASSTQRLMETSGHRADVAARHAANRASDIPTPQPDEKNEPEARFLGSRETRAEAQARKESAAADLLEIELATKRGSLIAREEVDAAMRAIGTTVRSLLDVLPDQIAPLVAPVSDLEECHQLLGDAARDVLVRLGEAVTREKARIVVSEDNREGGRT
jgi:phage terminase Nu1 subunit (DNA packaging protein)